LLRRSSLASLSLIAPIWMISYGRPTRLRATSAFRDVTRTARIFCEGVEPAVLLLHRLLRRSSERTRSSTFGVGVVLRDELRVASGSLPHCACSNLFFFPIPCAPDLGCGNGRFPPHRSSGRSDRVRARQPVHQSSPPPSRVISRCPARTRSLSPSAARSPSPSTRRQDECVLAVARVEDWLLGAQRGLEDEQV
jgi:hypothetical protein